MIRRLRESLLREVDALPLDLFRAGAGLLCLAYFSRQLLLAGDFSLPDGLLDHALILRTFWFCRESLFQAGTPAAAIYAALGLGWLASWGIVLGWRVKPCAGAALVVAVSLFRWDLPVIDIDDFIIHLLLLWMLLLPVGRTLVLSDRLREGPGAWERWKRTRVPGAAAACLKANYCLVYLIAGPTKLASPMWRHGFALYATLATSTSRTHAFWGPQHLPFLRAANYLALAIEICLPALLLRPKGDRLKLVGLLCQAGLHGGIIALFGLPFINSAMLLSSAVFFGPELMDRLRPAPAPATAPRVSPTGRAALAFVVLLALAVAHDIPVLGALAPPAYAALWAAGMFQDYRLFDWIDAKNYRVDYEVTARPASGPPRRLDPELLFPSSTPGFVLQAYLYDIQWAYVPCRERAALKESILRRAANRFCRRSPEPDPVSVSVELRRVSPDNLPLDRGARGTLMEFRCSGPAAALTKTIPLDIPPLDCRPGGPRNALERLF